MIWRIGTRGSKLATIQTELVRARLAAAFPEDSFEVVVITTRGDRETSRPIAAIGDNALFTREIETALLDGRIDLAVHSMKDLPAECPKGLCLAKAWPREDPRDVLVARQGVRSLDELPLGAVVATGSPRRSVLLRRMRPDLKIVDIRGNVDTRLRKLFEPKEGEPQLDAIVLAAAGLKRLGREDVISCWLDSAQMIPAPNQGQLAIEVREDDVVRRTRLERLGSDADEIIARTERCFLRELGVDCHMPVGALASVASDGVSLRGVFARNESSEPVFAEEKGADAEESAFRAARAIRRQVAGVVTLVGAGPGDPELITVRGLKAIGEADVIVYDRLVSADLLKSAKPGCELVYAGKANGRHEMNQDEINALLAKKALAHSRVVRLKGGDPFVFGRGGEEAIYLAERGIVCRVVPGVTSAVAAAASAGIPVTHRGVASSFEVVTAHTRAGASGKTRVYLMGLDRIGEIVASLRAVGESEGTPVAVVSSATLPSQRCVIGTLADIAGKVASAALVSPAVVIVGDVVALRSRLTHPLSGRRFLVPQIEGGESRLSGMLVALGADVDAPVVGRIVPIPGSLAADQLKDASWLALTSPRGLLPFDEKLVAAVREFGLRIAVVGKSTAAAVRGKGLSVDFIAQKSTGSGFCAEFSAILGPGDLVLHPVAEGVETPLSKLSAVCAYRPVPVYRNEEVPFAAVDLSRYDAAFFTCASSAKRTMSHASGSVRAVALGPETRRALEDLGVADVVQAESPQLEHMIRAVEFSF